MKWPVVEIKQVAEVASGFGFPREYQGSRNEVYPFFKVGDMNLPGNERCLNEVINTINEETLKKLKARAFPKGTIVFPKIGAAIGTNKKRILVKPSVVDNNVMGLIPNQNINEWYLYYWMQQFDLRSVSNIGPVPSMRKTEVEKVLIPLPPLSEQRQIVSILDQADALRKKRTEADAKAARILPALFYKMFGDPAINPKGWQVVPLGEIGSFDRGRSRHRPRNAPELLGGPYPFVQTGDVANSQGYISTYSSTYSELGLAQSKMWPAGTLCITIAANIAATAILGFDACFPDSVVGFTPNHRTNSAYVRVLLSFFRPILERSAPQVAQKNINLKILRELPVPVPPREIQDRFMIQHDGLLTLDEIRLKSGQHLDKLWTGLIHRAFSGDLTAKWREAHMKEMLAEMELQTRYLNKT